MSSVASRVRSLIGEMTERKFARMSGIPYSTLKGVLEGSRPSVDKLVVISDATKTSLRWLATGEGEMRPADGAERVDSTLEELPRVPRYPVSASAGHGRFLNDAQIIDYVPFPKDFFIKHVRGNPKDMFIIDASGDSMEPTMRDGDMMMIDRSTALEPINAGIYCFTLGDLNYVKRLQQLPTGLLARSDNKDYAEFMIDRDQMNQFHPIGRVVWIGRTL